MSLNFPNTCNFSKKNLKLKFEISIIKKNYTLQTNDFNKFKNIKSKLVY